MSPIKAIHQFGQSIWLDYIRRNILQNGELQRLLDEDGLRGVTSNPAIFEKAIGGSTDYDADIRSLAQQGLTTEEIYTNLAVSDVQAACDLLRPIYDEANRGGDGYVSLEVSPELVDDTAGTVAEGLALWKAVARPNVMIKVPATLAGLPAIRQLIAAGVNINVTLIFNVERYQLVADAYMSGLEDRLAAGESIDQIDSVASFFLSRIDVLIDPLLEKIVAAGGEQAPVAQSLVGEVAIASAKQAYKTYLELIAAPRWAALQAKGAQPQRLLWASTGNKNPKYDNLKYVASLIGPHTVNTVPVETLDLYRTGGTPAVLLNDKIADAEGTLAKLAGLGLDLTALTNQLEREGAQKFTEPFGKLMDVLEKKRLAALAESATSPA
jgi:transaldolase